jgi:DNA-binding transcriptional regulator YhcF (GntR family)
MSGQAMLQTEPGEAEGHRPDLAARIAAWLEGAILGRALAPGAKLPTEGMLGRQLGVSRAVVREAIARVKSDGLAQSRQVSGLYVTDPFERRSFRFDEELAQDEARMLGFFELRQPVEIAAAHFAAARRTDEDMARIVAALEAMTAAEDWSEDGVRPICAFTPRSPSPHRTATTPTSSPSWEPPYGRRCASRAPTATGPRPKQSLSASTTESSTPSTPGTPALPSEPCTPTLPARARGSGSPDKRRSPVAGSTGS